MPYYLFEYTGFTIVEADNIEDAQAKLYCDDGYIYEETLKGEVTEITSLEAMELMSSPDCFSSSIVS